jgi:hypothetical protein
MRVSLVVFIFKNWNMLAKKNTDGSEMASGTLRDRAFSTEDLDKNDFIHINLPYTSIFRIVFLESMIQFISVNVLLLLSINK